MCLRRVLKDKLIITSTSLRVHEWRKPFQTETETKPKLKLNKIKQTKQVDLNLSQERNISRKKERKEEKVKKVSSYLKWSEVKALEERKPLWELFDIK